jgi:hypothetical protein
MEENEYRDIYHQVNDHRCIFEKSILTRQTMCQHAHRFCLADREGVSCHHDTGHARCKQLLEHMRNKATFALKLTRIDGPLPHTKEIKVQTGGLLGLAAILADDNLIQNVTNIYELIDEALGRFGKLENLPYDEVTRRIVNYEVRLRRRGQKNQTD